MGVIIIRKSAIRPTTLADVLSRLNTSAGIESKRRALISAVNSTCKMLNRQPGEVAAKVPELRAKLLSIHPQAIGITTKTFANIKANLARALETAGAMPQAVKPVEANSDWKDFFRHAKTRHQPIILSRLARYCSARGIAPSSINNEVVAQFCEFLHARLLTKDPHELCKEMAQTWNAIVKRGELNLPPLTVPRSAGYSARPLSSYPKSLEQDVKAYIKRLEHPDLFDEKALARPLRATTIRNIRAHIRQLLDAAVSTGYAPDHFTSLADLINTDVIRRAFDVITSRIGRETSPTLLNMLSTILAIARHYVGSDSETIEKIAKAKATLADRLGSNRPQMTMKNMERLDQFNDLKAVERLINLPDKLMAFAKEKPASSRRSLAAMHAAAISILLAAPMRIGNLASLDLERDIRPQKEGKRRKFYFHIEGASVKNNSPIDFCLDGHAAQILATYLDCHRHRLSERPGTALFPKKSGGPRPPGHLGEDLKAVIWREAGLKVNAHLFRHLALKLLLQHNPGDYETAKRLLTHRKVETTMGFYARLNTMEATERYDREVLSPLRGGHDR